MLPSPSLRWSVVGVCFDGPWCHNNYFRVFQLKLFSVQLTQPTNLWLPTSFLFFTVRPIVTAFLRRYHSISLASCESLRCLVYSLKDSVSSGPDNIPAYFIKRCWPIIESLVVEIFKKIVTTGCSRISGNIPISTRFIRRKTDTTFQIIGPSPLLAVCLNYLTLLLLRNYPPNS